MSSSSSKEEKAPVPFWVHMVSGTSGGVAMCVSGHPFETVKARMQTDHSNRYKGTLDCVKQSVRNEGFLGLYRGMGAPVAATGFLNLVLFTTSGLMKRLVHTDRSKPISLQQLILSSMMTAPVYVTCLSPIEVVKIRLQTDASIKGPIECVRQVLSEEGPRGLMRGWTAALGMRLVGLPVYFSTYELVKRNIAPHTGSQMSQLIGGGAAGLGFWIANYPLDTLKTLSQSGGKSTERNPFKTAKRIYKQHGIRVFWKGFSACLMRAIPANAVCFFTVEQVTALLTSEKD